MIIEKNILKYIVFSEDDVMTALKKISNNKSRIIFSVTESGVLEGVLTDGDFRRWLLRQDSIDLSQPVSKLSNKEYTFAPHTVDSSTLESYFTKEIEFIPLLDENKHLVGIAHLGLKGIQIGEFIVSSDSPAFIIAEIGNNHNGSIGLAKQLIDKAVEAGANCAKFQMRSLATLYLNSGDATDASEDLGSQYTLDLLTRFQLSPEEMFQAFDYCREQCILPLCTPWDLESLEKLEDYGMPAYKVASADLTNHELLKALADTGKPLICSTGMSTEAEIVESVALLKLNRAPYVLLHCNSTYPAPFKDINLNYMRRLRDIGDCPVGYSGHERGINIAIAAVANGAKVIEKHFTLDRAMEGNDHKVSLLPDEFYQMVEGIRQIEEAMGTKALEGNQPLDERRLSQGELMNREVLAKSLVSNCRIEPGQTITEKMISVKSPGKGLQPNCKAMLMGKTAQRLIKAGDFFYQSDLKDKRTLARKYAFARPWGLPVRYHDFEYILSQTNPDLLEFHLSYRDLEVDINEYIDKEYELDLVVHAPELFAGDHLLDLCSRVESYREQSIAEMQRVIDITRKLKTYFKKTDRTLIVTNVGGFSSDAPIELSERPVLHDLLIDSLSCLDVEGVEIIPQTMPPFPWHFGGQSHHNLFLDPEYISRFCKEYDYRVCLDVSHSKLACNRYNWSFKKFLEQVAPHTAHIHIADAAGLDGEGLQVGDGEIDFPALAYDLSNVGCSASFIPEIWQGHKNMGEGFWKALDSLEGIL